VSSAKSERLFQRWENMFMPSVLIGVNPSGAQNKGYFFCKIHLFLFLQYSSFFFEDEFFAKKIDVMPEIWVEAPKR